MNEKLLMQVVKRCESLLDEVETHVSSIKKMHDEMAAMYEENKRLQKGLHAMEQKELQKQLIIMASKAAKKAAKKSIAKAKIRETFKQQTPDQ